MQMGGGMMGTPGMMIQQQQQMMSQQPPMMMPMMNSNMMSGTQPPVMPSGATLTGGVMLPSMNMMSHGVPPHPSQQQPASLPNNNLLGL